MEYKTASDPPHGSWKSILPPSRPRKAKELKIDYKKARHYGQQLDRLTNDQLCSDFKGMGFDKDQTDHMMGIDETPVDGYAQLPNYSQGFVHKDPSKRPRESEAEQRMIGKMHLPPTYKHCLIDDAEPNWVLYDDNIPIWKYGRSSLRPELAKWMHYVPGNQRIVKYNTKTGSFGLSWTPSYFHGHVVHYTNDGPVLLPIDGVSEAGKDGRPLRESARRGLRRSVRGDHIKPRRYTELTNGHHSGQDSTASDNDDSVGLIVKRRHIVSRSRRRSPEPSQAGDSGGSDGNTKFVTPKPPRRVARVIRSPPDSTSNGCLDSL